MGNEEVRCDKCGKKYAEVLILVYIRDDPKEFFRKKLYCLECFTDLWEKWKPEP